MPFTTAQVEAALEPLARGTVLLLEGLSVLTVLSGLLTISREALPRLGRQSPRPSNRARLTFASWLALALEFQLGVVALIRTVLNVFLGREIEVERRCEEEREKGAGREEEPLPHPGS